MKRSRQITLLFSGALVTAVSQTSCTQSDPPPPPPGADNVVVSKDAATADGTRAEPNNSYTPGLGYYHAYSHQWFPYPYNYFAQGFGYFWGGGWNQSPHGGLPPLSSVPNAEAFQRARDWRNNGGSYSSYGGYGSGFHSSWGNSWGGGGEVSRGGFGESGHASGGGHGGGE